MKAIFNLFKRTPTASIDIVDQLNNDELIDIRRIDEYNNYHVQHARHVEMSHLLKDPERSLSKNKRYYLICQSGMRSSRACKVLNAKGFDTISIKGGTSAYQQLKKGAFK